jgi:hypothetical protein
MCPFWTINLWVIGILAAFYFGPAALALARI